MRAVLISGLAMSEAWCAHGPRCTSKFSRCEVLALRHQLLVLQRSQLRRLLLANADGWLWAWLSRVWSGWRTTIVIVKPETVIAWHRKGFRLFWTWKSCRRTGRPPVAPDMRAPDSADGGRESAVGRATDTWRVPEAANLRNGGDSPDWWADRP
jgi:hypothetical protein